MKKRIYLSALVIIMMTSSITACKKEEATVYFATETQQDAVADSDVTTSDENAVDTAGAGEGAGLAPDTAADTDTSAKWCVYICGSVANPGVYYMDHGTRICDLVDMAGGMTAEACTNYWNLAEELYDGRMIYVPTAKEIEDNFSPELWDRDGGQSAGESNTSSGKVNINTATKEQLMTLSGIGESKADSIIKYRTENGSFSAVEDITKVSGIGEAMLNKIKDDITVN
ncbi:helix-hairpin-helix domain-containing protein [Agathobacter sp.]